MKWRFREVARGGSVWEQQLSCVVVWGEAGARARAFFWGGGSPRSSRPAPPLRARGAPPPRALASTKRALPLSLLPLTHATTPSPPNCPPTGALRAVQPVIPSPSNNAPARAIALLLVLPPLVALRNTTTTPPALASCTPASQANQPTTSDGDASIAARPERGARSRESQAGRATRPPERGRERWRQQEEQEQEREEAPSS